MGFTFLDLQGEVKRRSISDQGGTTFDTAVKNIINTSLFRISREAPWRSLRRKTYFTTSTTYTEGSGAVSATNGSNQITVTGATFVTDGIVIGRRVTLSGSNLDYIIRSIDSETQLTLDKEYDGSDTTTGTYSILAQEEYNLPIQCSHKMFVWHEWLGYPYVLTYIPEQAFWLSGVDVATEDTPSYYRMWEENMVINQPYSASQLTLSSTSASDTTQSVSIFGTVNGFPDYEAVTLTGTTDATTTKTFSAIERVVKSTSTTGRVLVKSNSGTNSVAVLPVGDTSAGVQYRKIQLYPLPDSAKDINVYYYKDPYRLVNDNDVHELGHDFDECIILLSVAKMKYGQNQNSEGDRFIALYKDELLSLKRTNVDKMDWLPTLKPATSRSGFMLHKNLSYNQIGPNFGPKVW